MKKFIHIPVICIASGISFYIGSTYQNLESENKSEGIVTHEFQITEKHADIPSCSDINATKEKINATKNGSDYVIWLYDHQQKLVIKTIVTADMNTIYLETPLECRQ